jgi:hypothetical protein
VWQEHVDEELRELVRARGQRPRLGLLRAPLEEHRVLPAHHGRARARDRHHVLGGREGAQVGSCRRARLLAVPAVEGRLAAADLAGREVDLDAERLEHLHGGDADLRVQGIAQAGNHQRRSHAPHPTPPYIAHSGETPTRSIAKASASAWLGGVGRLATPRPRGYRAAPESWRGDLGDRVSEHLVDSADDRYASYPRGYTWTSLTSMDERKRHVRPQLLAHGT